jgi:hypothetical protein
LVFGDARVSGSAQIYGHACVCDNARVYEDIYTGDEEGSVSEDGPKESEKKIKRYNRFELLKMGD